eukprot:TRINITY_DN4366_c4_g1_i1.p1 TRINITY_DN4366_c4_g1~~TRINITY_DN4366_c4_g1_i1.p1  ORF type:complete len:1087 (+),score=214.32 TRINITY_DN4366_c4_g1_i1:149-3409(+)
MNLKTKMIILATISLLICGTNAFILKQIISTGTDVKSVLWFDGPEAVVSQTDSNFLLNEPVTGPSSTLPVSGIQFDASKVTSVTNLNTNNIALCQDSIIRVGGKPASLLTNFNTAAFLTGNNALGPCEHMAFQKNTGTILYSGDDRIYSKPVDFSKPMDKWIPNDKNRFIFEIMEGPSTLLLKEVGPLGADPNSADIFAIARYTSELVLWKIDLQSCLPLQDDKYHQCTGSKVLLTSFLTPTVTILGMCLTPASVPLKLYLVTSNGGLVSYDPSALTDQLQWVIGDPTGTENYGLTGCAVNGNGEVLLSIKAGFLGEQGVSKLENTETVSLTYVSKTATVELEVTPTTTKTIQIPPTDTETIELKDATATVTETVELPPPPPPPASKTATVVVNEPTTTMMIPDGRVTATLVPPTDPPAVNVTMSPTTPPTSPPTSPPTDVPSSNSTLSPPTVNVTIIPTAVPVKVRPTTPTTVRWEVPEMVSSDDIIEGFVLKVFLDGPDNFQKDFWKSDQILLQDGPLEIGSGNGNNKKGISYFLTCCSHSIVTILSITDKELVMRFGPLDGYRADLREQLELKITSSGTEWGMSTSTITIEVEEEGKINEAIQAAGDVAAGLGVMSMMSGPASGHVQQLQMYLDMECGTGKDPQVSTSLAPLQIFEPFKSIDGSECLAAVVGNSIILISFSFLHLATLLLVFGISDLAGQGRLRFPSVTLFVYLYLYQAFSLCGTNIMIHPRKGWHAAVGVGCTLLTTLIPIVISIAISKGVPDKARYRFLSDEDKTKFRSGKVATFILGPGEWVSRHPQNRFVDRFTLILKSYTEERPWFAIFEFAQMFLSGATLAIRQNSYVECGTTRLLCCLYNAAFLILEIKTLPHCKNRDNYLDCSRLFFQAVGLLLAAVAYFLEDMSHTSFTVATYCLLIAMSILFIKIILDLMSWLFIVCTGRWRALQADEWKEYDLTYASAGMETIPDIDQKSEVLSVASSNGGIQVCFSDFVTEPVLDRNSSKLSKNPSNNTTLSLNRNPSSSRCFPPNRRRRKTEVRNWEILKEDITTEGGAWAEMMEVIDSPIERNPSTPATTVNSFDRVQA